MKLSRNALVAIIISGFLGIGGILSFTEANRWILAQSAQPSEIGTT